ncbi:MAG: DUF4232 domain-containing protein [Candidatus Limnocylindrales bacterium]
MQPGTVTRLGACALAALLTGCVASPSPSLTLAPSSPIVSPPATPRPCPPGTLCYAPSASPTGSPATGVASCAAASLVASGGRQGESGIAHGDVAFTNVGDAPCSLSGAPAAVALVRADGTQLPVRLLPFTSPAGPVVVVLRPRAEQAAWLIVYWANWCAAAPGPLRLRITLGDARGTLDAQFDGPPDYDYVPRCDQPARPSTLQSDTFGPGG